MSPFVEAGVGILCAANGVRKKPEGAARAAPGNYDRLMVDLLVNIDVLDLEQGIRFYREGLGLRLRRRLGSAIAELAGAPCPVFLIQHEPVARPFAGAEAPRDFGRHWTPVHLDFVVPDLDAGIRTAESAGATREGDIRAFSWGRYLVMADPFGNGFCLLQFEGAGYAEIATSDTSLRRAPDREGGG